MALLWITVAVLAAQLAAGGVLAAAGGVLPVWRRRRSLKATGRCLRPVALCGLFVLVCLVGFSRLAGEEWVAAVGGAGGAERGSVGSGVLTTSGCWVMLVAGRRERRGELAAARGQARVGGWVMGVGALGHLATGAWLLWQTTMLSSTAGSRWLASSVAAGAAAGAVGLLAGLSGKPRPSGPVAAAFVLLGIASWAASVALG